MLNLPLTMLPADSHPDRQPRAFRRVLSPHQCPCELKRISRLNGCTAISLSARRRRTSVAALPTSCREDMQNGPRLLLRLCRQSAFSMPSRHGREAFYTSGPPDDHVFIRLHQLFMMRYSLLGGIGERSPKNPKISSPLLPLLEQRFEDKTSRSSALGIFQKRLGSFLNRS